MRGPLVRVAAHYSAHVVQGGAKTAYDLSTSGAAVTLDVTGGDYMSKEEAEAFKKPAGNPSTGPTDELTTRSAAASHAERDLARRQGRALLHKRTPHTTLLQALCRCRRLCRQSAEWRGQGVKTRQQL